MATSQPAPSSGVGPAKSRTLYLEELFDGLERNVARSAKHQDAQECLAVGGKLVRLTEQDEDRVNVPPQEAEGNKEEPEAEETSLEDDADVGTSCRGGGVDDRGERILRREISLPFSLADEAWRLTIAVVPPNATHQPVHMASMYEKALALSSAGPRRPTTTTDKLCYRRDRKSISFCKRISRLGVVPKSFGGRRTARLGSTCA